jgi:hypothetical protein
MSCVNPAAREDSRLARADRYVLSAAPARLNTNDLIILVAYDALDSMAGADVDAVATGSGGHRSDGDFAAVRHRFARFLRQKHPTRGRLVLGEFRPIVGHTGAVPIFKRALFGKQLGRQRRVVVDRLVRRVLPRCHAEFRVRGIVGFGPGQTGHVADAVVLRVLDAQGAHRAVVRHPAPKRGLACGPAKLRGFLENENLVPQPPREQGSGKPPGPRANDDDIDLRIKAVRAHWRR